MPHSQHSLANVSRRLQAYLPKLRRFARALTGQQNTADRAAIELMEQVLASPSEFLTNDPEHVVFYRKLLGLLDRPIEQIICERRRARLLASVGELQAVDVAAVLGIDERYVAELLRRSQDLGYARAGARLLIIEDDPVVAMELVRLIDSLGHACVGVAATADEALALARSAAIDLVISDLQLADGSSGYDAVQKIQSANNSPAIFITAYPELLLTGEKPEPIFLIGKPFNENIAEVLIDQALYLGAVKSYSLVAEVATRDR